MPAGPSLDQYVALVMKTMGHQADPGVVPWEHHGGPQMGPSAPHVALLIEPWEGRADSTVEHHEPWTVRHTVPLLVI